MSVFFFVSAFAVKFLNEPNQSTLQMQPKKPNSTISLSKKSLFFKVLGFVLTGP